MYQPCPHNIANSWPSHTIRPVSRQPLPTILAWLTINSDIVGLAQGCSAPARADRFNDTLLHSCANRVQSIGCLVHFSRTARDAILYSAPQFRPTDSRLSTHTLTSSTQCRTQQHNAYMSQSRSSVRLYCTSICIRLTCYLPLFRWCQCSGMCCEQE